MTDVPNIKYPSGNLLIRPIRWALFLFHISLFIISCMYKENLDISRWTGVALWFDSSVTGLGACYELLWICRVCHHLLIRLLPLLSLRWRWSGSKAAETTVFILNRGADPCSMTNLLASRCLSSTDIFVGLCAFCPLGRSRECSCVKRWAQAGAHRLAFGHWHMRRDRRVEIQTRNDSPVYCKGHSLYYFWAASKYLWSLSIYHITCATPSHLSFSLTSSQWHSMWATCGILQETSHCMKFSLVILQNM